MDALGINLGYLIVQISNFFIIFLVLKKWVYTPILGLLESRRQAIAQGLEDAKVAAEARANAEEEAKKIIAEAQNEASRVVREATERAEAAGRDIKAQVDAEAAKAREQALEDVEIERKRLLSDLRGQVAGLSIAAAQKLIGEALDEERQHMLINEFFSGVEDSKVVVLEGTSLQGASAEVTSALPLTEDEQQVVRDEILTRIGSTATTTFRVDPAIMGGLVIRVGDKILDGSVASKLDDMRQRLS